MGLLSRRFRRRVAASEAGMAPANVVSGWADRAIFSAWETPSSWIPAESRYQPALKVLAGPPREGGYLIPVEVTFVREAENPRHPNALYVEVRGRLAGYVAPELADTLAPALDRSGVDRYTCCGVIRGGSYTATSLSVHVWPDRRPCPGLDVTPDGAHGGALASWPPWETEGISRAPQREPRRARARLMPGAQRWAGMN